MTVAVHRLGLFKLFAAFVLMGVLAGCRPAPSKPLYPEPGALFQILNALREAAGSPEHALSIEISPYRIAMQVQDKTKVRHINEYVFERSKGRRSPFYWDVMSGPKPVQPAIIAPDLEANLFSFSEVNFDKLDALIEEAMKSANLEDAARVASIDVRRATILLPKAVSGDVRISLYVTSDRENATVYADASGSVTGLDLSGTNRARTLNLFAAPGTLSEGVAALSRVVGTGDTVLSLKIEPKTAHVQTNVPETQPSITSGEPIPGQAAFSWTLDGVKRDRNFVPVALGPTETGEPFDLGEIDLGVIGKLIESAPAQLKIPGGSVVRVKASKPRGRPHAPRLIYEVDVEGEQGKRGKLLSSKTGETLNIVSSEITRSYFAPGAFADVVSEIKTEFGPDAKLVQISIEADHISVTTLDPNSSRSLAVYTRRDEGFVLDGTPSALISTLKPFTFSDIQVLTPDHVTKLTNRALETLGVSPSVLSTITIGRNSLYPSPKGTISLEVRSNDPRTFKIGLVNYELDGTVIRVNMP